MRVLELTELYPPDIGGTQRHVARQAEELAKRGHEVIVVTHAISGCPEFEVTPEGITVLRTEAPWLSRLPGIYQNPRQRFSSTLPESNDIVTIRNIIRQRRPDVVLAHNWIIYSYLAIKTKDDPPVLWILHDYGATCHKRNVLYEPKAPGRGGSCPGPRLDRCIPCGSKQYGWTKSAAIATGLQISRRLFNSKIDQVIAISSAVEDVSQSAFKQRIRVVPSFLAEGLREVAFSQERPDFCPEDDYLLYVGSLDKHKGVDVLLKAHQKLEHKIPLVIIGTARPGHPPSFEDGVKVVLNVEHDQVMGAWAHCTLGVVPSIWEEPWGQVAAEAATVGKAVVASRVGGLKDIVVDGETGVLVPPNDPTALQVAIDRLLSLPELRDQLGRNAIAHVQPYTVSVVTDQIEEAMAAALSST